MLIKLVRQEMKTQGRTISVMYGVLAIAAILVSVLYLLSTKIDAEILGTVFMVSCSLYAMTVVIVVVVNFIYLCFHFYQSMYSAQGYLTHTLPVKTLQILHVKVAVSFGYLFVTGLLCMLSFAVIGTAVDGLSLTALLDIIGQALQQTAQELGISPVAFVCFFLLLFVFGCLDALLMFFAGSSIGQLFHRSKGACGIAASIGLYYCSQIVSLLVILLGYLLYQGLSGTQAALWAISGSCLLLFGWTMVYYIICRVIVQKHLNLE